MKPEMSLVRRRQAGFTLVELLVVIAIITVLAGMLLPTLSSVLETARRIGCANNLKQLALGVSLYRDDSAGFYPALNADAIDPNGLTGQWWPNPMSAYIPVQQWKNQASGAVKYQPGTVWTCPEVPVAQAMWCGGYGCNNDGPMQLMKPWGRGYNKGDFMKRPNDMVILGDTRKYKAAADGQDWTWIAFRAPIYPTTDWLIDGTAQASPRHAQRSNVSFQDCRVEGIRWLELYSNKTKYFEWWN